MAETWPARTLQLGEPRAHRGARRGAGRSSCAARSTTGRCATPRSRPSRSRGSASSPSCHPTDLERGLAPERLRELEAPYGRTSAQGNLAGLRVWNRDGRVVYADEAELVGQELEPSDGLRTALSGRRSSHKEAAHEAEEETGGDDRTSRATCSRSTCRSPSPATRAPPAPSRSTFRTRRWRRPSRTTRAALYLVLLGGLLLLYLGLFRVVAGCLQAAAPPRRPQRAPGPARRAHRPPQPNSLPRPHRAGAAAVAARARARRRAADRPRPLQGGQRHARPPEGRPAPQGHRHAPGSDPARERHHRPSRRRRVRRAPADARQHGRRRGGRREDPRHPRGGLPHRRAAGPRGRKRGHRALPAARRGRGHAAAARRRGHVRGQAHPRRPRGLLGRARPLQPGAPGDGRAAAQGAHRQRGAAPLPAEDRPGDRQGGGRRGARSLAAPGARPDPSRRVRADGRADRPDPAAQPLRAGPRSQAVRRVARLRARPEDLGQPVGAQPARPHAPRGRDQAPDQVGDPGGAPRARDHREHDHDRPQAGHGGPRPPARDGHRALDRRLRHRLLVARLPEGAAGERAEDRPHVRRPDGLQPAATRSSCARRSISPTTCT